MLCTMDYKHFLVAIMYFIILHRAEQYENLALNKTVTVSQRYNNKDFDPSLAVDGDHSTDRLKCSLTASGQKEAWLTVDLGEGKNFASLSFIHGGLGTNAKPIDLSTSGIFRSGTSSTVQTNTASGWLCYDHFTVEDAQVVCMIWGLLPDNSRFSEETSTNYNSFADENYECIGNETSILDCSKNDTQCPSFRDFFKRTELNCKEGDTLSGFSVRVSDTTDWKSGTLCYQHDITQPLNNTVTIDCFTSGRYVTIYNSRNNTDASFISEFAYINVCEINITGCNIGFYGDNCTKCPDNCLTDTCQFQIGHCFGCNDGFKGEMCEEECPSGSYGRACSRQCGNCLNQGSCDHISGVCHGGCLSGWIGDMCDQECLSSFYGTNCNTTCSEYCQNRICHPINGYCLECIEARTGNFCENKLAAQATFEIVSFLIATTSILFVLVVVLTFFTLKRKCMSSRKSSTLEYDVSDVKAIDRKYETLQRKTNTVANKAGTDTTAEYMEISDITSDISLKI